MQTKELTFRALKSGFRHIDTANQRKHYNESAVGEGLQEFILQHGIARKEVFIQTKFTHVNGQDHRLPYNVADSIFEQVKQSCSSSLNHLGLTFIDSFILHGPLTNINLCEYDWEAWHAMETIFNEGKVQALGISNVNLTQLQTLYNGALVKPTFVQNRCYASTYWDRDIRLFWKVNNILYQGGIEP